MLFYIFAALAILSAAYMVLTRNLLYAGFSLLITLLSVAGIYVLLFADFIAVTQLMVYVGGVLVLLLFGIMLSSSAQNRAVLSESVNKAWGIVLAGCILAGLSYAIVKANVAGLPWLQTAQATTPGSATTTVHRIGIKLMTDYVVPFELVSLLLLIALIGAAYIATDKPTD